MRFVDYASAGKTIAASTTIQFTSSDVPSNKIVAYHFAMTGGGNTLAVISRIRVKANGVTFWDLTPAFLRAYLQRFAPNSVPYPAGALQDPLSAANFTSVDWRRFTLPFCDISQPTDEAADLFQFPPASNVTIEIQFTAGAAAGTMFCGWTETDAECRAYPKLTASQMNIAASVPTAKYPIVEEGVIRGLILNTIGLGRAKLVLNGRQVFQAQGQPAASTTFTGDSLIQESQQLWNDIPRIISGGTPSAASPTVNNLTDPTAIKIAAGENGQAGRSFLELTTIANWGGAANEIGLYSVVPLVKSKVNR